MLVVSFAKFKISATPKALIVFAVSFIKLKVIAVVFKSPPLTKRSLFKVTRPATSKVLFAIIAWFAVIVPKAPVTSEPKLILLIDPAKPPVPRLIVFISPLIKAPLLMFVVEAVVVPS